MLQRHTFELSQSHPHLNCDQAVTVSETFTDTENFLRWIKSLVESRDTDSLKHECPLEFYYLYCI